jgi:hypothetical protein
MTYRFEEIFKDPKSVLINYYRAALKSPLAFVYKLDLDDDNRWAVGLAVCTSVLASLPTLFGTSALSAPLLFLTATLGVLIMAFLHFVVAYVSKAEIDFKQCLNMSAHTQILTFPIALFSFAVPLMGVVAGLLQLYFFYLCLVKRFYAHENTVVIMYFFLTLISFGPLYRL